MFQGDIFPSKLRLCSVHWADFGPSAVSRESFNGEWFKGHYWQVHDCSSKVLAEAGHVYKQLR
jgi:hypothetical protein